MNAQKVNEIRDAIADCNRRISLAGSRVGDFRAMTKDEAREIRDAFDSRDKLLAALKDLA